MNCTCGNAITHIPTYLMDLPNLRCTACCASEEPSRVNPYDKPRMRVCSMCEQEFTTTGQRKLCPVCRAKPSKYGSTFRCPNCNQHNNIRKDKPRKCKHCGCQGK